MINTDILRDIITDHKLCSTQEQELRKAIKEIEEKQAVTGWISVKDRLPDKPGPYIVNYKRAGQPEHDMDWKYRVNIIEYSEYWTEVCQRWWNGHHWAGYGEIVTHWMPLPEPPKEDGAQHEV